MGERRQRGACVQWHSADLRRSLKEGLSPIVPQTHGNRLLFCPFCLVEGKILLCWPVETCPRKIDRLHMQYMHTQTI